MELLEKSDCHIKPFIKWAGGKDKELEILQSFFPKSYLRYVEPFVGGGSVFFNTLCQQYVINDKSEELINLYKMIESQNELFFQYLNKIASSWKYMEVIAVKYKNDLLNLYNDDCSIGIDVFISKISQECVKLIVSDGFTDELLLNEIKKNLSSKIKRAKKIEMQKGKMPDNEILANMECALKSSFYMYIRYLYNSMSIKDFPSLYAAVFYFIREYCYSSMFRYNSDGKFNVPYGGISYNKKDLFAKIEYLHSEKIVSKLQKTSIYCEDFEKFLEALNLNEKDFIFLDPPYDTEFSTYAKNIFDKKDQIRLAEYLKKTKAKFLLVIKETDFIRSLYSEFNIFSFDKHYLVSFKNRNKKDVTHLIITNY